MIRRVLGVLAGMAGTVAVAGLVLYLLVIYRPSGYDPLGRNKRPEEAIRSQNLAVDAMLDLSELYHNGIQKNDPFTLRFEQDTVNNFILHKDVADLLDQLTEGESEGLRLPQVRFGAGRIEVMGQVRREGITAVLTVGARADFGADGQVRLGELEMKLGALPVPERYGEEVLARALKRLKKRELPHGQGQDVNRSEEIKLETVGLITDLLDKGQASWEPEWSAPRKRRARIMGLRLGEGYLEVDIASI